MASPKILRKFELTPELEQKIDELKSAAGINQAAIIRALIEKTTSTSNTKISENTIRNILSGKPTSKNKAFSFLVRLDDIRKENGLDPFEIEYFLPTDEEEANDEALEVATPQEVAAVAKDIPRQSDIVKFGLGDGLLSLVPSQRVGEDHNDYNSIEVFIAEMMGPLDALRERYRSNPNAPHCDILTAAVESYAAEVAKAPRDINYTLLYARGRKLIRAMETARQQMSIGEWPEFEPQEAADLTLVSDLHGSIMMRSGDGAKLVNEAFVIQATPEEIEKEREIYSEIGEAVAEADDLVDAEGREFVRDATKIDPDDKQVSRSQFLAFSVTTSVLSVAAAGAVYATAGTAGGIAAAAVTWIMLEALKKTKGLKEVSEVSADAMDAANEKMAELLEKTDPKVFQRMHAFVMQNHARLLELAKARKEFAWIEKALKLLSKRKGG